MNTLYYYQILELDQSCSLDDIKKAYRRLAMKYHPDRNNGSKISEEKFKVLKEAYDYLISIKIETRNDTITKRDFCNLDSESNDNHETNDIEQRYWAPEKSTINPDIKISGSVCIIGIIIPVILIKLLSLFNNEQSEFIIWSIGMLQTIPIFFIIGWLLSLQFIRRIDNLLLKSYVVFFLLIGVILIMGPTIDFLRKVFQIIGF